MNPVADVAAVAVAAVDDDAAAARPVCLADFAPDAIFSKWALFRHLGYFPSVGQRAFHESPARFRVLIAGARFGKSLAAAKEILTVAMIPGARIWICGPTYHLAEKEFHYVLQDLHRLPHLRFAAQHLNAASGKSFLRLPWGSEIITKSADRPESLLGDEIDLLVISEASQLRREIWERFLRPRLGSRLGRAIIPTTPTGAGDWVHECYQRGHDPAFPDWQSFGPFATCENPTFSAAEYAAAKRSLAEEVFAEQYEGRFVRRSGLVYPEFSQPTHVIAAPPPNWPEWGLYRSIDFGFRNPFVCLWATQHPRTGAWYVIDELYRREMLVEDAAAEIRRRYQGIRIHATIADHDAEDRATLRRHGIPTIPAIKPVGPGIATIKNALRGRTPDATQTRIPSLFVAAACKNLIAEFAQYAWDELPANAMQNERPEPRKFMDHALDALRYLLVTMAERNTVFRAAGGSRNRAFQAHSSPFCQSD